MPQLQLSLAMAPNARSNPVLDGKVEAEGIEFLATRLHPSELFWRQLHFGDFDVSEMSMSSLLIAVAGGNRDWVGLPVFTTRRFFTPRSGCGDAESGRRTCAASVSGIRKTSDGRAVGARRAPARVRRRTQRHPLVHGAHRGAQSRRSNRVPSPAGVRLTGIPADKSIGSMLVAGEVDATVHYLPENNLVDRSRVRLQDHPEIRQLFPDPAGEGRRYFAKTGLFPINHGMVVRRSIVERHPWVVLNVYNAFRLAKEQWLADLRASAQPHLELGMLPEGTEEALKRDPSPTALHPTGTCWRPSPRTPTSRGSRRARWHSMSFSHRARSSCDGNQIFQRSGG